MHIILRSVVPLFAVDRHLYSLFPNSPLHVVFVRFLYTVDATCQATLPSVYTNRQIRKPLHLNRTLRTLACELPLVLCLIAVSLRSKLG